MSLITAGHASASTQMCMGSDPCSAGFLLEALDAIFRARFLDQELAWDAELFVKRPDHGQRQRTLARQHLGGAILPADDLGDVRLPQSLLLHPEKDCLDRIGLAEFEPLLLVILDQLREQLQPGALGGAGMGVEWHESLHLLEVAAVLALGLDDANVHSPNVSCCAGRIHRACLPKVSTRLQCDKQSPPRADKRCL